MGSINCNLKNTQCFVRLLLIRVEFGTRVLIFVYGFVNSIPNIFDRIPILLQHFCNFLTLKEQQLWLLQILTALLIIKIIKKSIDY